MSGRVWVILPTYNEVENLERVVRGIRARGARRARARRRRRLDGRDRRARRRARRRSVLHRPGKAGLGRAYAAGFATALAEGAELVVEMDADLSHDPADLPRLIAPAEAGADLVLGSRYVDGGGIEDWDVKRRVLSHWGCGYARHMLGVGVRDLTGGFKCFRATTLRAIDATGAGAQGYAFQVELTWRTLRLGLGGRRGAHPVPRAEARRLEDVRPDRARGRLAGAGVALRPAPLATACGSGAGCRSTDA